MYSRRVFSNNNNINFIDYNNIKKGEEIYKNIHSKGNCVNDKNYLIVNKEVRSVLDYQTFLNLTRTYFRHCRPSTNNNQPSSINDGNTSFICYNHILSHINDCDYCCNCKDINKICECKEIQNILYPYGSCIQTDKKINDYNDNNFDFPAKLKFYDSSNNNCNCNSNNKTHVQPELSYGFKEKKGFSKYFNNYYGNCCEKNHVLSYCYQEKKGFSKYFNNYYGNCSEKKTPYCINNIFPSQHQFMYYKSGCYPPNNYDEKKRMNAFATYPQIGGSSKTFYNFSQTNCCNNVKPLFIRK